MLQKTWVKLFIWFMAISFFFLASGVVISIFKPGPSEAEVMQFMMGMMSAMENSMMGVAMGMGSDGSLNVILGLASAIALPTIFICVVLGFLLRFRNRGDRNV